VLLSEGTFNTAAMINLDQAECWLQGHGPQATKINVGTGLQFGLWITASNVTLSDMWLTSVDGDNGSYANGTHCVGTSNSGLTHLRFYNLYVHNFRNGIKTFGNKYIWWDRVHFKTLGGQGLGSMGYAAVVTQYCFVTDCIFEDTDNTGCTFNPGRDIVIEGGHIIGDGSTDKGRVDISSLTDTSGNIIIANVISEDAGGLLESATPTGGASAPYNVLVTNCIAKGYYDFPAIQGKYQDLTISNCHFESASYYALNITQADQLQIDNVLVDATGYTTVTANAHTVGLTGCAGAQINNLRVLGSGINSGHCLHFESTSTDVRVCSSEFRNSLARGINAAGARASIVNCRIENNERDGIQVGQNDTLIQGCLFKDNGQESANTYDDVTMGAVGGVRVLGCRFEGTNVARHYDESSATGDPCMVMNNDFDGTPGTAILRAQKTGTLVRNNRGWVTENSGTGSIASGTTADTITHGLSVTPTVDDIAITLAEDPTNSPGAIWVDTLTSTQFNVNCENDPGASNLDFGWRAAVL
jgi:hypothetical protein